ncbi:MAG: hypothetical protein N2316_08105 [Spirochaetes bacterium]|nr:hypothetical protein [Spirochaetota bacterium]
MMKKIFNDWAMFVISLICAIMWISCLTLRIKPCGILPNVLPIEEKEYEMLGTVEGESSSFYLLWVIPVTLPHRLDEAMKFAIQEKGADNLINVRWYLERQVWIVGTVYTIHAEGDAIRYVDSKMK